MHQAITVFIVVLNFFKPQISYCYEDNVTPSSVEMSLFPLETRIVGGKPVNLEQFPFNVQFLNNGGMCGGTILTSKTVLTAAHCFDLNTDVNEMRIFSNSRYMFDPGATTHEIWEFIKHENYNVGGRFINDIAIIMIRDNFTYGKTAQKAFICNTDKWMNENEKNFAASGWGETTYGGEVSQKGLMQTHLRYISPEKCMKETKVPLNVGTFCLSGDGKRDTCRGDSGGGIVWKGAIVGIVSHGSGCAKGPGMYTHVNYYMQWIQDTVDRLHRRFCKIVLKKPL